MRTVLVRLPHVIEAEQFGGLIYWLADKSIGGKMFALMNFDRAQLPISFPVGPERYHEMLEVEGIIPAPYLARIFWVAAERWGVLRESEWQEQIEAAHALTLAKLPPKTRKLLELPKAELARAVAERRKVLAERAKAKR